MNAIDISVIIPVKRFNRHIERTIEALAKGSIGRYEIIVVVDERSEKRFSKTTFLVCTQGPAEKRDVGAKKAKGEILAFLDDDAYPSDNWLRSIIGLLRSPDITAVCGPGITPPEATFWEKASGVILASPLGAGTYSYRFIPGPARYVDDFPSMNLAVRKTDFNAVGGFDSHYWPGEDTKLCLDLVHKLGKKIVYDPQVFVYHHRRPIFWPHLKQQGSYGLHRGFFARVLPKTSARISYFLPSILLFIIIFSFFYQHAFTILGLYGILLMLNAVWVLMIFRSVELSIVSVPGVFLTHVWYGLRFIQGFLFTTSLRQ